MSIQPLQKRIGTDAENLALAIALLKRGKKCMNRMGWEKGETDAQWMTAVTNFFTMLEQDCEAAKIIEAQQPAPAADAEVSDAEMILRRLLWLNHGHDGLYGDDGEMQCGRCLIDYKRTPAAEIEASIVRRNMAAIRAESEASR